MKYQIAVIIFALTSVLASSQFPVPSSKVDKKIWKNLEESELTNVLITFKKADTKSALNRFYALKLITREAILDAQHAILKDHADIVQADVKAMLDGKARLGKKHYLDQLWISNELIARDVDSETVEMLSQHPDIASLVAEQFIPLERMIEGPSFLMDNTTNENQWGIVHIDAPAAWARGVNGLGVTIGSVDTGARHTHIALAATYRGNNAAETHNFNWRAPTGNYPIPFDTNGRGTHSIGIHSGTHGIGVAPNSRWMACRACATDSCSSFDINSCGNFMACPTNTAGGDHWCARAPRVIFNGWSFGGGQTFYNGILAIQTNAGMLPVFGTGNTGNGCSTVGSPADQPLAFGVGSITSENTLSTFSGVGPGPANAVKPNVAAPGTNIVSASHIADNELRTLSGTAAASAHVAGTAGLVLHIRFASSLAQVRNSLLQSGLAHVSEGRTCDRSESSRPNNHVGEGHINANAAA